jgi:hypothetical protein
MKILVENSTWNNVGDGFYQSTLYVLLTKLYPNDTVVMGEGPIRRSFRPKNKRQISNLFQLMDHQTADVHIFSGPILHSFMAKYSEKVIDIKRRGNNYAFISTSSAGITEPERKQLGEFFQKYPPLLLSTRDEDTYHNFKEYIPNSYNGFCTAFLVNKLLPVDEVKADFPFFVSSFYLELEPFYKTNGKVEIDNVSLERKPTYLNLPHKYTRHLNFMRPQQDMLDTHKIVRVHQDLSTHFYHIKFSHPNSFMSFNLLSYLALYKSADFTVTDRVHSCAASVAFGKPARLYSDSPRAAIFHRLGYKWKTGDIVRPISTDIIDKELELLSAKIKESF